jgi:hypothetical protein
MQCCVRELPLSGRLLAATLAFRFPCPAASLSAVVLPTDENLFACLRLLRGQELLHLLLTERHVGCVVFVVRGCGGN